MQLVLQALALAIFSLCGPALGVQVLVAQKKKGDDTISRIVTLIEELKTRIEEDGKAEQGVYDKYACWCEETLGAKAADITSGKDNIEALQTLIVKLKGELGAHGADIQQLNKDIAGNIASQKEANEVRSKESEGYQEEKTESEQCVGALEAAINVLAGAGSGKTKFLETLQEAQLLGVAANLRSLLGKPSVTRAVSGGDLELVRRFVERPEDFMGAHASGAFLSAAQIANNPFGDYAPQSTRIQGILKSMYESFSSDLERANAEESVKEKAFQELMATKKQELTTLQASLEKHTMDEATKTKLAADSKSNLDDAQAQLAADETFFATTKSSCKAKAGEWAERSRLRTEELQGITKAVEILTSDEAKATFHNATTTFLQISAVGRTKDEGKKASAKAYDRVRSLATKYKSLGMAKLAVMIKSGGHFDKVINAIDNMIKMLREEEAEDVAHRDRCEGSQQQNSYLQEDLNYNIDKATKDIERMQDEATKKTEKISTLKGEINATNEEIADLLEMRTNEHNDFLQALKDDQNAINLLGQAIVALTEFYRSNGIALSFTQNVQDPPPETWTEKYEGRGSEGGGVVAILSMIKEDLEKEIKVSGEEDAAAQINFESDRKAMNDMLSAQKKTLVATEGELADLNMKISDLEEHKSMTSADLGAASEKGSALELDCAWVATHFESRRTKRKTEMDGLNEAKNFLAGVEAGDDPLA